MGTGIANFVVWHCNRHQYLRPMNASISYEQLIEKTAVTVSGGDSEKLNWNKNFAPIDGDASVTRMPMDINLVANDKSTTFSTEMASVQ